MIPAHLRTIAKVSGDVSLAVEGAVTIRAVLDALEAHYPALRGTVRDQVTGQRRAFIRFFACSEDWSHESVETELPAAVVAGKEPFLIIGAIAGGSDRTAQLEAYRPAVTGHCYRMLGSAVDAEDAAQETLIRAWRGLDGFDGRASLKTWLHRIATNVCLDELKERGRRARPMEEGPASATTDALTKRPHADWLDPIADAKALPTEGDPAELAMLRQSIRLAFVAALQHLAPKQRATLLLVEVLGWSAADAAETLETTVAAVNSASQRARAVMASRDRPEPGVLTAAQRGLLDRYLAAFERYDVDELAALLRQDVTFSMRPYALWLQGPEAVRTWLVTVGHGCRGSRLVPIAACGSAAFAQYRPSPEGGHVPWAIVVLELAGDRIAGWNSFLDTEALFPHFGLAMRLEQGLISFSFSSCFRRGWRGGRCRRLRRGCRRRG